MLSGGTTRVHLSVSLAEQLELCAEEFDGTIGRSNINEIRRTKNMRLEFTIAFAMVRILFSFSKFRRACQLISDVRMFSILANDVRYVETDSKLE